jgi:hypothetical protein
MRKWIMRAAVPVVAASAIVALTAAPAAQASVGKPTVLSTVMTGAAEVPGPGDPDGRGVFVAVVKGDKLCYVIAANRIEPPVAAHIHVGAPTVAGPIVVGLTPPNRVAAECIRAVPDGQDPTGMLLTESELAAIVATPSNYYVNVHTPLLPAGAIRGQLH